ncbi:hypothetical protein [Streptomyces sp. NRRL WC-3549]|uniref:hypothetical protein n=1 Tax=Streptomyces sp. NRRL WC-3549 TaxID=1463925 RepID=UPI00068F63B7|nr:hypothetical protein [Streptomyces sp. NRRL WC-3549]
MQSSHATAGVSARFDDSNLIAYGGLAPLVRLAERCGLPGLVVELVRLPASANGTGAFQASKVMALVAGMAVGAGSIDEMDRLRHGAVNGPFRGVRAPSTLGSFLRPFTHGHVNNSMPSAAGCCYAWRPTHRCCPARTPSAHLDLDDTIKPVHGYAKRC